MNYSRLLRILLIKESIHYKRLYKCLGDIHTVAGKIVSWPIICLVITFFHYCFATMHLLFETFLFLFKREQFNVNVVNLEKKLKRT